MARILINSLLTLLLFAAFPRHTAQDNENDSFSFIWNPALSLSGPVVVRVNFKTQAAVVYRNGIEIGSCVVSMGKQGVETPTSVFHILEKDADLHSPIYNPRCPTPTGTLVAAR